ncbi:RHS repeat-associated core domain-containing protein [Burkholderia sp. S-53]|uniref:RHS repeat-associated core domain-containing protein n=1 Tax=Burkholderia sp. S-53 TaxID=2906514 RepID=UPI0021D159EA|nr:RHS repeat-associated core domain-containing protein [Burkholderia sp. S-53]UXU86130.1 hypothetical protein LXM88_02315 [Burkholderia sp. S-53]
MSAATVSDAATARRCAGTPTVTVIDNRGLVVRTVQYNRTAGDDPLDELITRQSWSARSQLLSRIDPRLFDERQLDPAVPPNFRYVRALSGQPLAIASQDAGNRTALYDVEGGAVWQHDSRDQQLRHTYDLRHRPVSVTEQAGAATPRISERLLYGDATAADNANLRGQLRQAWSPAGMAETPSYSLAGQPLATVQQFLRDDVLDSDWASDNPGAWVRDLAPDTYTTRWAYNALGQELERVDACHNRQRQHFNVAGQLAASELQLADQSTWQPLLRAITYSAAGQVLREEAGNGVVTDYTYEPQTQRLAELHTTRPPQAGRTTLLQALSYQYDPVGNLLAIDDAAKATRHTRNQRVAPASHYSYDALYQLTRATGRENANAGRQSQALPPPIVPLFQEIGELTPYTRTYRYDRGANLTTLQHQGTRSSYTQQMVVARTSNRAVPQTDGLTPGDVASYFDACGNLKALGASQPLAWDSRNQLQRTTQVVRRGLDDDTEVYWYDGAGQRATKLGTARTSGTTRTERVRYLPGLELRQIEQTRTGETLPTPVERLQVLTLGAAGRQSVRLLHWELGQPSTIENDQLRVSLDDQIGSSMLELDAQADLLTWEEYYPYGGTAVWSARSDTEAKYKYVRYSGQERDATGLYYYGFRYYAPWLARWLNPDPAGPVDGLNLFCMVKNNPITQRDALGMGLLDWLRRLLKERELVPPTTESITLPGLPSSGLYTIPPLPPPDLSVSERKDVDTFQSAVEKRQVTLNRVLLTDAQLTENIPESMASTVMALTKPDYFGEVWSAIMEKIEGGIHFPAKTIGSELISDTAIEYNIQTSNAQKLAEDEPDVSIVYKFGASPLIFAPHIPMDDIDEIPFPDPALVSVEFALAHYPGPVPEGKTALEYSEVEESARWMTRSLSRGKIKFGVFYGGESHEYDYFHPSPEK